MNLWTYVLAAGFYVTLWGGVAALVAGAVWFATTGGHLVPGLPDWALAGWCAFTALFVVVAQFASRRGRSAGRPLEREAAPALFDLIDDVRRELDAPPVREVRLKPAPVLGVTHLFRRHRLFVREHKVLVLGLPFLRAYSVDELRGAVAHEMAHFAAGDVRRRRIVNGALARMSLMRTVLERGRAVLTWANPLWWFLRSYEALFRRAVGAIRRAQECGADAAAARTVGTETYARTLLRGAVLGIAFRRLALGILVRARRDGRRIENFYREFDELLTGRDAFTRERAAAEAMRLEASPLDEHPALAVRLGKLGFEEPPDLAPSGARTAAALVPGLEELERSMTPLAVGGLALGLGARLRRRLALGASRDDDPGAPPTSAPVEVVATTGS